VPFYGIVVACNDDPLLRRVLPKLKRRMVSYGTKPGSDFQIKSNRASWGAGRPFDKLRAGSRPAENGNARARTPAPPCANSFLVKFREKDLGEFRLHVPGLHNVLNATAAIAVGVGLDIPVAQIREALENFRGVDRRFQLRGTVNGIAVIDDYGHHPTEIRATLAAARQCGYRKIHVIFQPHRYTRTRDLMDEFATAFSDADSLCVLDIYPASEQPIEGITGEALAKRIAENAPAVAPPFSRPLREGGNSVRYVSSFEEAVNAATEQAHEGDMILTLGAGSVSQIGLMLLEKLHPMASSAR
jgi:UDP-N-acetylmuramate--alanine ligase